jgi:hypothetical protein
MSATDHDWTRVNGVTPDGEVFDFETEETDGDVQVWIPVALDVKAAIPQVEAILDTLRKKDSPGARREIVKSLRAVGFMESQAVGGYALRLPAEWATDITILLEGCGPTLALTTPGGAVFADLTHPARALDDAESRLATAPTPSHENCELCGRWHRKGESHCPNCDQPAESGFHASGRLDKCPYWLLGRWVMPEDLTDDDRAELVRQREGEVTR